VLDTEIDGQLPDPYGPAAGQSLEERVAALGELVNQLREWAILESQAQSAAIAAGRAQAQQRLEAEARRLDDSIAKARQALERLEDLTVGSTRLRWVGVPLLLIGVAFTTWEKPIAANWPPWLAGNNLLHLSAGLMVLVAVGLGAALLMMLEGLQDSPKGGAASGEQGGPLVDVDIRQSHCSGSRAMSSRSLLAPIRSTATPSRSPGGADQKRALWAGEAVDGELVRLTGGRTHAELVELLVAEVNRDPNMVVGLDFAFSLPAWYLRDRGLTVTPWSRSTRVSPAP
jgi:hypothetical protein